MKPRGGLGGILAGCAVAAALLTITAAPAVAAPASDFATACTSLTSADLHDLPDAPSTVESAELVAATPQLPAHCAVRGTTSPQVQFAVKLPEPAAWTGRFLFVGCGGPCGYDPGSSCDGGLVGGFATASTDSGHRSTGDGSMEWAHHNPAALTDWTHRSPHVATVAAKAVTERLYGRAAQRSYFTGCSTGGRQAMIQAQRYPGDFDGIMANSPGHDMAATLSVSWPWLSRAAFSADGRPLLDAADVTLIAAQAMMQCDPVDGLVDGLISAPAQCRPTITGLPQVKSAAVQAIYAAPANTAGPILARGVLPGSEGAGEWTDVFAGGSNFLRVATESLLRFAMYDPAPGAGFDLADWSPDHWPGEFARFRALAEAVDPDLDAFRDHGGKLMITQGLADVWVNPAGTTGYYDELMARYGGYASTSRFVRLFTMPGAGHCVGEGQYGPTGSSLTALVDWVERGVAPERIDITYPLRPEDHSPARTRPVFPYPHVARYLGSGSIDDPAAFGPALPG